MLEGWDPSRGSGPICFDEDSRRRGWKMIQYMDLNEQVDSDFTRARRRALLRGVLARLRKKPASNELLCFDDQRRVLQANNRHYLGRRVVETQKIVGSVGRCSEFDQSFLPLRASAAQRWKRIDRAFHRSEDFPPVELYKMGNAYFIADGHHRLRHPRRGWAAADPDRGLRLREMGFLQADSGSLPTLSHHHLRRPGRAGPQGWRGRPCGRRGGASGPSERQEDPRPGHLARGLRRPGSDHTEARSRREVGPG